MRSLVPASEKGKIETKLKKAEDTIKRLTTERQEAFDKEKKAHEENQRLVNQLRRMEGLLGPPPGFRDTLTMRHSYELTPQQQENQNIDRASKNCFYCHHSGHKARDCPERPDRNPNFQRSQGENRGQQQGD